MRISLAIYVVILLTGIAVGFWPLVVFQVALGILVIYLQRHPASRLVPVLALWIGPFPRDGERESTYSLRLACFAVLAGVTLAGLGGLALYLGGESLIVPNSRLQVLGMAIRFGVSLGVGMALLGGALAVGKAMWLRASGTDHTFTVVEGDPEDGT